MGDFLYDHTGRKFLKCAQLMDEATFGRMSPTAADAQAPNAASASALSAMGDKESTTAGAKVQASTSADAAELSATGNKAKQPTPKVFKVDDL